MAEETQSSHQLPPLVMNPDGSYSVIYQNKICVLRKRTHPAITNHVILQNIFKYGSSLQELQRNRLVCKAWLSAASAVWNKLTNTIVLVRQPKDNPSDKNQSTPSTSSNDGKFSEKEKVLTVEDLWTMCVSSSIPTSARNDVCPLENKISHRKVTLRKWRFDMSLLALIKNPSLKHASVPRHEKYFWTKIAPLLILDLCLEDCKFPIEFIPFSKKFLEALPRLRCLKLKNCNVREYLNRVDRLMGNLNEQEEIHGAGGNVVPLQGGENDNSGHDPYVHSNLTSLEIHALNGDQPQSLCIANFLKMLPNIRKLKLHGFELGVETKFYEFIQLSKSYKTLEELDFLDFSMPAHRIGAFHVSGEPSFLFERLKVLHIDVGFDSGLDLEKLCAFKDSMPCLERLHIYRGMLSKPFEDVHSKLKDCRLPTVTELHISGNLSNNLAVLQVFPNLKKLVWNTSCFDSKHLGKRCIKRLIELPTAAFALMNQDFVQNTKTDISTLPALDHLEIDWSLKTTESWERLARIMPNLSFLKVKAALPSDISTISKCWKKLLTVELRHGSDLSPLVLLDGLKSFHRTALRNFKWFNCPCNTLSCLSNDFLCNQLQRIGDKIGVYVGTYELYSKERVVNDFVKSKVCLYSEYLSTLESGNAKRYFIWLA